MQYFNVLIVASYLIGFILCLIGLLKNKERLNNISLWSILFGYLCHTVVLFFTIKNSAFLSKGQFYFGLFGWSLILIFLIMIIKMKIQFLSLVIAPLALIFFSSSFFITKKVLPVPKMMGSLWFGTHILCLFFAISFIAIGFGAAIFYLYIHKQIKNKTRQKFLKESKGYSLEVLDKINHYTVVIGFPLFTIGIISGFIWARLTWHKMFSFDIKEIWSIIVWGLFAYLFHQRVAIGWKGKKPAVLILWIFVLSLISFLIINSMFPTHHSFR